MKIYWVSRHDLSPAQRRAISDLHGVVEVVKDPVEFKTDQGLAEYIRSHSDGFVYAVATGVHYLVAGFAGLPFGMFTNHPGKRADGQFGLAEVHWVNYLPEFVSVGGQMIPNVRRVWVNPDPAGDEGEPLIPVARSSG